MHKIKNDQLDYYLTSLNELGEILIDASNVSSVSSGVLRLTLGTIMASTGSVLLYNKEKKLSFLAAQGSEKKKKFHFLKKQKTT